MICSIQNSLLMLNPTMFFCFKLQLYGNHFPKPAADFDLLILNTAKKFGKY